MRFVYDSIDPDLGKKPREINPGPRHISGCGSTARTGSIGRSAV